MGSPLGPLLANAFMCSIEETLHREGKMPTYYKRFVDDTLTIMPNKTSADNFLDILNQCHSSIKFTFTGRVGFCLEFDTSTTNGPLSITGADTGTTISVTAHPGKNASFEPIYYWGFTMFRCLGRTPEKGNTAMYLGCNDSDNRAVLVQVEEPYDLPGYYPDPRTLFIASRA
ncbi:PREDICTED: uncharacterized protein LOC107337499 [Acropora digitifera]|uniref:uncharacterized protein LOC107337499 n=1 Tax=Acropora digitifera TaxID=70779 RepID=UPI00077A780F|nr:PREDICTED: uncharacterized protein LOC107337499 [Acropora digitifera]